MIESLTLLGFLLVGWVIHALGNIYEADRATPERWLNIRSRLQGRLALRAWNRGVGRAR